MLYNIQCTVYTIHVTICIMLALITTRITSYDFMN